MKEKERKALFSSADVIVDVLPATARIVPVDQGLTPHAPAPPVGEMKSSLFHSQRRLKSASAHPLPIPSAACTRHSVLVYFLQNGLSLVDKTIFI